MSELPVVEIYTDGGCQPNPGVGGWGAILISGERYKELAGGEPVSTNNRMELTAAIESLRALKKPCHVLLHTDSEYVKNGITTWLAGWKRNGWRKGTIKNQDLWQALDAMTGKHRIEWRWVRGHAGHALNERCDQLAGEAIARIKAGDDPGMGV